jgi:hypothetical protein
MPGERPCWNSRIDRMNLPACEFNRPESGLLGHGTDLPGSDAFMPDLSQTPSRLSSSAQSDGGVHSVRFRSDGGTEQVLALGRFA